MSSLFQEVLKNIIPVLIVGVLGYFAKLFLESKSSYKWRHVSAVVVIAVASLIIFSSYRSSSEPYIKQYTPEATNIIGAKSDCDFNGSYWLIEANKPISIPLYIKKIELFRLKLHSMMLLSK